MRNLHALEFLAVAIAGFLIGTATRGAGELLWQALRLLFDI